MSTQNSVVSFLLQQMDDESATLGLRLEAAKTLISLGFPEVRGVTTSERNLDTSHCQEILLLAIPDWTEDLYRTLLEFGFAKGVDRDFLNASTDPVVILNLYNEWVDA